MLLGLVPQLLQALVGSCRIEQEGACHHAHLGVSRAGRSSSNWSGWDDGGCCRWYDELFSMSDAKSQVVGWDGVHAWSEHEVHRWRAA